MRHNQHENINSHQNTSFYYLFLGSLYLYTKDLIGFVTLMESPKYHHNMFFFLFIKRQTNVCIKKIKYAQH